MPERLTVPAALAALTHTDQPFAGLLTTPAFEVEIYRPVGEDLQQPHTRDELYVVIAGRGFFVNAGRRQRFEPGEVLYVPAGVAHRFEHFSDDFATWVIFAGPQVSER